MAVPGSIKYAIIGAGIHGLSTAYHLALKLKETGKGSGRDILVLDKTAGVTSFDAVALVRRRLGLKRVGHAGTLDPDATGVLPILLGEATKLMAYLADQDKEYVATLRLGVTTDTGDLGGRVTATAVVPALSRPDVEAACRPFVGRTDPPHGRASPRA